MKNLIPLVVAVVLGLVAVFAVSRALAKNGTDRTANQIMVVMANGNLKSGGVISKENVRFASVPLAYVPKQHILKEQAPSLIGQTLSRDVVAGDYLQWNDIGRASSVGESVGEGEWAIPLRFQNSEMVALLKPGDEIAVVGRFRVGVESKSASADVDAATKVDTKTVTAVLFPQVRIMNKIGNGVILLSLPPQQAMIAISAQEDASLYAVLRRPNDEKATNRKDGGMFDGSAFVKMLEGCPPISIPDQPVTKMK